MSGRGKDGLKPDTPVPGRPSDVTGADQSAKPEPWRAELAAMHELLTKALYDLGKRLSLVEQRPISVSPVSDDMTANLALAVNSLLDRVISLEISRTTAPLAARHPMGL